MMIHRSIVGGFLSDVRNASASAGASVVIGKCEGGLVGPFQATKGGTLVLPDGREFPEER